MRMWSSDIGTCIITEREYRFYRRLNVFLMWIARKYTKWAICFHGEDWEWCPASKAGREKMRQLRAEEEELANLPQKENG